MTPRKTLLHVGCGRAPLPPSFSAAEWREIRCDIDPQVQPDVVASMTDLGPIAAGSVDAIFSSHNLEHLAPHEVPLALAEFRRVLRPGGAAWILVPDIQALAARIAGGDLEGELYHSPAGPISVADVLWGHGAALAEGRHYMAHRNGFSAATLEQALRTAGFAPVRIVHHAEAFELFATAMRPAATTELFALAQRAQTERRWPVAETLYREVLAREDGHWPAWLELGVVCYALGRLAEAVPCLQRAVQLQPASARARLALGCFLALQRLPAEAEPHLREAVVLDPASAEAHHNLGKVLQALGDLAGAEAACRAALQLEPARTRARLDLAETLLAQGRAHEALPLYQAAADALGDPWVHGNLPMLLNYAAEASDVEVFAAHEAYGRRLIAPLAAAAPALHNRPEPLRRLRIAYLSRDFCRHSLTYFLVPLITHHDRAAFDIACYHFGETDDAVTAWYRSHADRFVDCAAMDDDTLAARLRDDGIDILVDLAGLTDRHRMGVIGRRPAPVQIGYLGYPATTGVRALDYRLSDRWIDPEPPASAPASSETPLRLAHGYFCYMPLAGGPAVNALPAATRGHLSFGSLAQAPKLNDALLQRWARILCALPGSRLVIQNGMAAHAPARERIARVLAAGGVDPHRIDFRAYEVAPTYLTTYHDIDIALDTDPFNGGTTTCEALWMGVPVVSRCGGRHVARLGASILNRVGLPDLVAHDDDAYVAVALRLAGDLVALARLRQTMRARLATSPLMDRQGFTRELETAYRRVWQGWCEAHGSNGQTRPGQTTGWRA